METTPTPTGKTEPQVATAKAVACSDLVAGDLVRWTHFRTQGSSTHMTTRTGKVIGRSTIDPELWTVKWRGKQVRLHRTHLRRLHETSTLNEIFDAITKPATSGLGNSDNTTSNP